MVVGGAVVGGCGSRAAWTRSRISPKSGFELTITSFVNGRERTGWAFTSPASSRNAGKSWYGHVGGDDVLGRRGELEVVGHQGAGVGLLDDGVEDAALALHALVVVVRHRLRENHRAW